ncbi:MAG: hypothetical protein KAJ18_10420, partial [Candidatus Omnitrophica bacterium]|nr:hypothetical protein [Candidatus Omnitrophota bacterium]
MKKILLGLLLVVCAGCTTVYIPAYVQDVNPYKKRFYANHDRSLAATMQALNETGWEIEGRMDPAIYEKIRNTDLDEQEILLTTTVRNFPLLLGVKYGKM